MALAAASWRPPLAEGKQPHSAAEHVGCAGDTPESWTYIFSFK